MVEFLVERANYWAIIGLMMLGLYITFEATNMIKRLVGLSIFQTSVFLLYITLGKVAGGTAPILYKDDQGYHGKDKGYGDEAADQATEASSHAAESAEHAADVAAGYGADTAHATEALVNVYSNPLPHVLILTAIVVGVATLSVGLAIVVRIREAYGTIESDDIREIDINTALAEEADDAELAGA